MSVLFLLEMAIRSRRLARRPADYPYGNENEPAGEVERCLRKRRQTREWQQTDREPKP